MVIKPVEIEHLADNAFNAVASNNRLTITPKIAPTQTNMLRLADNGLVVEPRPDTGVSMYTLSDVANARVYNGNAQGKQMRVSDANKFGQIHVDIVYNLDPNVNGAVIMTISSGQPTSKFLIETVLDISRGTTAWLDAGSRQIRLKNGVKGQRYIFDLQGFFN